MAKPPNRIREWRLRKKLSQAALGALCELSNTHISRMERDVRNVSLKNLAKVAKALHLDESDLVIAGAKKSQFTENDRIVIAATCKVISNLLLLKAPPGEVPAELETAIAEAIEQLRFADQHAPRMLPKPLIRPSGSKGPKKRLP